MGIQRGGVQRLLLHSVGGPHLGINIQRSDAAALFDYTLVDNMLHMHSACVVPMRGYGENSPSAEVPTPEQLTEHIVGATSRVYLSMARNCRRCMVLFDDGFVNFKPAVRTQRDRAALSPAARHLRDNQPALIELLFDRLEEAGVRFVHVRGPGPGGSPRGQVTIGRDAESEVAGMNVDGFAAAMRSGESDTLMFEFVLHVRRAGNASSMCVMTKDSDVVPTAMAVLEHYGDGCLGDTCVGFVNPLFYRRAPGNRDLPTAMVNYGWNPRAAVPAATPDPGFPADAQTLGADVIDACLDANDAARLFPEHVANLTQRTLTGRLDGALAVRLFGALYRAGIRGPAFRQYLEWYQASDDDFALDAALTDFSTRVLQGAKPAEVLRLFRSLAEHHVESIDDSMGANKVSHVGSLLRCIRRYMANEVPHGFYGHYCDAMRGHSIIFMRLHHTPRTAACVVLCALSGTDYNVALMKLGAQRSAELLSCDSFAELARRVFRAGPEDLELGRRLINAVGVGYTETGLDEGQVRDYADAVYRTLCYTLSVWRLEAPRPSAAFGFDPPKGFTYPLELRWSALQRALGTGRSCRPIR